MYGLWMSIDFLSSRPSSSEEEIYFEVRPSSGSAVYRELKAKNLIEDEFKFRIYMRLTGQANEIKVGEYLLRPNMRPPEIASILTSGVSVVRPLVVPEGYNMFEIAQMMAARELMTVSEFLKLCTDKSYLKKILDEGVTSCEGYLYPDTYAVTKFTKGNEVVEMMLKRFIENYSKIEEEVKKTNFTRNEFITLASIVEKETGAPEERSIVSSVYHNRLKKNMRLQADPTVLYGKMIRSGKLQNNITRKDLLELTPYNTYAKAGLPVGPIANPGLLAMQATLNPAKTDYIYFVSRNDGTHVFSVDYKDHKKAVRDFQLNRKAREGKSWRDLKKRNN